jgi:hypothetical protein
MSKVIIRNKIFNRIIKIAIQLDVKKIKDKNPNLTFQIDKLINSDPSGTKKYILWQIKQLKNGNNVEDLIRLISYFNNHIESFKQKDINKYLSLEELEKEIKIVSSKKSKSSFINEQVKAGAIKIYEEKMDKEILWQLYRIDNKFAAQALGRDSSWCITQKNEAHYEEYSKKNILFYYIIDFQKERRDPHHKFAASIIRDDENNIDKIEWFDSNDNKCSIHDVTASIDTVSSRNIEKIMLEDAKNQSQTILFKINNDLATEQEIDKQFYIVDKFKESINNDPNSTDVDIDSVYFYEKEIVNLNSNIIRNKIINLAKKGDKEVIKLLNSNYPDMIETIIDLAKSGNETAISRLNSDIPEMRETIVDLYKKGYDLFHEMDFSDPEMRKIILEVAKTGNEYAILQIDSAYPEARQVIIDLAKKGNNTAITRKLNPAYPEMYNLIIELVNSGNEYWKYSIFESDPYSYKYKILIDLAKQGNTTAISKLNLTDTNSRQVIIDLAKQGNSLAISRLDPRYPEMKALIDLNK